MMCPPSDDGRSPRNYYGYGANTLWFQYILCQQESIPSLACWLFTSGWNQADFGQYYLYDNFLGDDDIGIAGLDGDLLPLVVLSGGLGGGAYSGPAHSGGHHALYRREVTDDKACPSDRWVNGECVTARNRRSDCPPEQWVDGKCVPARKRRSDCPPEQWVDGECVPARKRRSDCPPEQWVEGKCVPARKRRSDCPPEQR